MTVREHFVPTLDGERLTRSGDAYFHADGTAVDPARLDDIVFVNAGDMSRASAFPPGSTGWWHALDASPASGVDIEVAPALAEPPGLRGPLAPEVELDGERFSRDDVSDLLRTLADAHPPLAVVEFDPAFFHRTLVRWMGLESEPANANDPVPVWDYDFWKAELVEEATQASEDGARTTLTYRVDVHRGDGDTPEAYRYWIELDTRGALARSGWLTDPPDLLGEGKQRPRRFSPSGLDPSVVEALLSSPD